MEWRLEKLCGKIGLNSPNSVIACIDDSQVIKKILTRLAETPVAGLSSAITDEPIRLIQGHILAHAMSRILI